MSAVKQEVQIIDEPRSVAAQTPMDLLKQAVANGNLELAEKMMGLQERWEANQARKAFDAAVADAKAEIKPITRTTTGHNSKKYADFAAIARAVDPIISKHGLSYRFRSKQDERINVTCVLSHKLGHCEETTLSGPPDKTGNKNDIQAIGSTLTYLQRYSLMQALGLAASNDDDAVSADIGEKVTEKQAADLVDMLEAKNADRAKFLRWVQKASPAVQTIDDIPAAYYDSCVAAIKAIKP
ncbi:MAG: ERF family protein [Patescibacteria group bacterium]|nr:ERF family protein [Patescibacteria group bacterium]